MKTYTSLKAVVLLLSLVIQTGCTNDFEEINTNPTAVEEVSDPSYFFAKMIDKGVYDNYQRTVNLYSDFYAQYFANCVDGYSSPQYGYVDDWVGRQWNAFYVGRLKEYENIKVMTTDKPATSNMFNMAEIYIVYLWSRMVDYRGDMPYFDLVPGEVKPYDSQEEIYPDLIRRLAAATDALTNDENQSSYTPGYDLLYDGNVDQWRKFGNSLRLRLAMRLVNIDPTFAKEHAEDAIADGVMESNADVAKVGQDPTGWYDYLDKIVSQWDNARISRTFTDYLNNESVVLDPRAPLWLTAHQGGYQGVTNGYTVVSASEPDFREKSAINASSNGYQDFVEGSMSEAIMFYCEVLFLRSEAALRGWNAGGSYEELYKQGIRASMEYVGVTDQAGIQNYIDGLKVDIASLNSDEARLKQLITQKWIANFPNGMEGWADFRRSDYPDLTLPADGVSSSATVAPESYVKRIRYPDNEHNTNVESLPEGMRTPADDRMDIRLWWDTADTKTKSDGLMNTNF